MHLLIAELIRFGYLELQLYKRLLPCFHPVMVPNTEILLRQDTVADKLFFIADGLGRMYRRTKVSKKGKISYAESTRLVAGTGEWFTEPAAFLGQDPSTAYLEVCGSSRAYYITHADYQRLFDTDAAFRRVSQLIWATLLKSGVERERMLRINTPIGDRLDTIFAKYPQLRELAPDRKVWASLAGVSESTLKRWLGR